MTGSPCTARAIALYLPQFHPIPENDRWWEPGFTEWTNVARARPLFRGHDQPHLPANLGFYDLRVPETREAQAALARRHGIEAFCYWHYWFGDGVRILERPFDEVLATGKPDFPFCLAWANETWTGVWHGLSNRILVKQTYPGWDDHRRHFELLARAFHDRRYLRVDRKPLFVVYRPDLLPDCHKVIELWRNLADRAGLPGLHLVAQAPHPEWNPVEYGFDAGFVVRLPSLELRTPWQRVRARAEEHVVLGPILKRFIRKPLDVYPYRKVIDHLVVPNARWECYPGVLATWDNTPRCGRSGLVYTGSTPELFRSHLRDALKAVQGYAADHRILVLKSWNEWAEGNYLEPDQQTGTGYLEVLRSELTSAFHPAHAGPEHALKGRRAEARADRVAPGAPSGNHAAR